jgi:hypothetical protein
MPNGSDREDVLDCVTTKRLEICDSQGKCKISLDCWRDGQPFVRLYDDSGCERLVLSLNQQSQPQIGLLDQDGRLLVGVGVSAAIGSGINIFDGSGNPRIVALVDVSGNAIFKAIERPV